jgi:hypothetical protein
MATRVCPNCGSQYVASVRRCIDCDVVLVDEVDPEAVEATAASPIGDGDQIGYELEGWGNQLKVTLEGMLDKAGIRRVWESGALVVPADREEEVDQLIATVEGGDAVELDDDTPQVAFEIQGLRPEEIDDLDARLIAAHIAHAWNDDADLLVSEEDEEAVAAIIDEVMSGEDVGDDGGLAVQDALSELYVAVDKLLKSPADRKLVTRYVAATDGLDGLGVPYGLSGDDWKSLVGEAQELAALVDPDVDPDPDPDGDGPGDVDGDDSGDDGDDVEATGGEPTAEPDDDGGSDVEADTAAGDDADEDIDEDEGDATEDEVPDRLEVARSKATALRTRLHDFV